MPSLVSRQARVLSVLAALLTLGTVALPAGAFASPSTAPAAGSAPSFAGYVLPTGQESATFTVDGITYTVTRLPGSVGPGGQPHTCAPPSCLDPSNCWPTASGDAAAIGNSNPTPAEGSLHGLSVTQVSVHIRIQPDSPCSIQSLQGSLDTTTLSPFIAQTTFLGQVCCTGLPENDYLVKANLPAIPGTGTHAAQLGMTVCCDCQGGNCVQWSVRISWSFTVRDCGPNALQTTSFGPQGTNLGNLPTLTATFQDLDIACGAASARVLIDGRDLTNAPNGATTLTTQGSTYSVSWQPSFPMTDGSHTVQISVTENCCNPQDAGNVGSVVWTIFIQDCGTRPVASDFGPQGTVDSTRAVIHVNWHDPDTTCGLLSHTLTLTNAAGQAIPLQDSVSTLDASDYYQSATTPTLAPGPYTVTAQIQEVCCSRPAPEMSSTVSWTFNVLVEPGATQRGETWVPGSGASANALGVGTIGASVDSTHLVWNIDPLGGSVHGTYVATNATAVISLAGLFSEQQTEPVFVGLP